MSRIGRLPIEVPAGVKVSFDGASVSVEGPKGKLTRTVPQVVSIREEGGVLYVERPNESREARSHHGLVRSLVSNMVIGCSTGYTKELQINGVGYRAEKIGQFIRFDLGYSHPIYLEIPAAIEATVAQTSVKLASNDKELIGQFAAKVRSLRKPEPYKGKGIKYSDEVIIRKEGKKGGK